MHRRVTILQYLKTSSGRWQWAPIPKNKRTGAYLWSKTKSNRFYIAWREQGRRRYAKAGSTASEALEEKRRKEFELLGRGMQSKGKKIPRAMYDGLTLEASIAHFMDFIRRKRRPNTFKRYRAVMQHLAEFLKPYALIQDITPADIDAYRDERLSQMNPWGKPITPRNVNSEITMIRAFFYHLQKYVDPSIANSAARMKPLAVTRKIADIYDEAELDRLFASATPEEVAVFKTFYFTGLREQEIAHLHWSDLNLNRGTISVRAKPEEGFIPKNWEERELPLHPELAKILADHPKRHNKLIFPSIKGQANGHLLRLLKRAAQRAQLPGHWYLHKFRKTFATRALERGADIRTVQALLGHKNITTTVRYIGTSTDKMREAVRKL
jgi:site-specific recombinase XerD